MAKSAGVPTTFAWDESGSMPMLLSEKTSEGTTRYIYGPTGSPIARIDNSGKLFYHHDQLGSIRAITNENGDTVGTATYDPYGTRTHHSGITTPFGFAGEYTDTETGFQYLRARYYDPATSQFLTRDPITAITQEPYGYVGGNPLNYVDPLGQAPQPPTPSKEEEEANEKKEAGEPYDEKACKRYKEKEKEGEKYGGERNKRKRSSNSEVLTKSLTRPAACETTKSNAWMLFDDSSPDVPKRPRPVLVSGSLIYATLG